MTGFHTGMVELAADEIEVAAQRLLGLSTAEVPLEAQRRLRTSTSDGKAPPCIVIHSATPVLRNLQGDLDKYAHTGVAEDTATYMETRAVTLAEPGDLVVGRTEPWLAAAREAGVEAVVVPGEEYYYLSQALLQTMVRSGPEAPAVRRLADALEAVPGTEIKLYSLDLELQIALLYLRRLAGIEVIYTDANSPEVSSYWNTKAPIYPRAWDAAIVDAADEPGLAPMRRRLGLDYERLPGYAFDAAQPEELLLSARLMRERHLLDRACIKASRGGGGARIVIGFDITDEAALRRFAEEHRDFDELFIMEENVSYDTVAVGGQRVPVAPSAHIRHGGLADGVTLQLTQGTNWQGNVYLDRDGWIGLGLNARIYDSVRDTVARLKEALGAQLVTGGVDFAVAKGIAALQDPNLSSHGAEYLRRYVDRTGVPYAATKVFRPSIEADLRTLRAVPHPGAEVVSTVPGNWGMLAAGGASPDEAVSRVMAFERELVSRWLA
ncbi:hypothetical protein [Allorhizocola rhizosphaerae]|uniref:hypothetical protein n=1 Tax=Allorhizocola rhizosphaerae TaxID=1872709 RepID=UPI0013C3670F|nr:hypothetical protein [Allorhizocola rhizosphaerae]